MEGVESGLFGIGGNLRFMSTEQDAHSLAAGKAFPWHECYVPDVDAAVDFYTKAFDMGIEEMDMGPMGTYKMLKIGGVPLAGIMSTDVMGDGNIPPHWAVYMSVDDVDARVEKATGLGANVVVPAMDIPNVGRMALISDPQGAHIWLYKGAQ